MATMPEYLRSIADGTIEVDQAPEGAMPGYWRNGDHTRGLRKAGKDKRSLAQHSKAGTTSVQLAPTLVVELGILTALHGSFELPTGPALTALLDEYASFRWCLMIGGRIRPSAATDTSNKGRCTSYGRWLAGLGFTIPDALRNLATDAPGVEVLSATEMARVVGLVMIEVQDYARDKAYQRAERGNAATDAARADKVAAASKTD